MPCKLNPTTIWRSYGLSFPERIDSGAPRLDFMTLQDLSFQPVDAKLFPGLQLAWDALRAPAGTTAVLNAANEIAVEAFLAGTIAFTAIHKVNARTLERLPPGLPIDHGLDDLLDLDRRARGAARQSMKELAA